MAPVLADLLATALAAFAALHLYRTWTLGGRWGFDVTVPITPRDATGAWRRTPLLTPDPAATALIDGLLLLAALIALDAASTIAFPIPDVLVRFGIWSMGFAFLLRSVGDFRYAGFFKRVRSALFVQLDTRLYNPLSLTPSALDFGIALATD